MHSEDVKRAEESTRRYLALDIFRVLVNNRAAEAKDTGAVMTNAIHLAGELYDWAKKER